MSVLIINERVSGTLLPLNELIARMQLERVATWRFREISLEAVSDEEFRAFLGSDFQIID